MASSAGKQRAAQRAAEKQGPALAVEVNGTTYTFALKDMTALDVRALRQEYGVSWNALVRQYRQDSDLDTVAAIVWMARRMNGERELTYAEIAAEFTAADEWNLTNPEPDPAPTLGEDDSPEA